MEGTAATIDSSDAFRCYLEAATSARLGRFSRLYGDLSRMESLGSNWDSYGAEPPSTSAIETTQRALRELERAGLLPNAVVASAEGGVGIVFVRSARYADVEFLNDGDILMSTYYGEEAPVVRELPSAADVVGVIQRYISA